MNNTPGPWHFDGHGINSPEGERICKVSHSDPYEFPEGEAVRNARFHADSRLIAAAPDLLSTLKGMCPLAQEILKQGPDEVTREVIFPVLEIILKDAYEIIQKLEAQ